MKIKHLFIFIGMFFFFAVSAGYAQKVVSGKASYYGNKFHGRRTSDGSVYHRDSLTCAHRTLPFGTLLKVRNVKNGREVIVKVNDRGPFVRGRLVDLSYAAAKEIGMIAAGVARVEVKNIGMETDNERFICPSLHRVDPFSGEVLSVSEWAKRGKGKRYLPKDFAEQFSPKTPEMKIKGLPRWQIDNTKATAKAERKK